ncbi:hypothetical protein [Paenibacillus kyungheensis]
MNPKKIILLLLILICLSACSSSKVSNTSAVLTVTEKNFENNQRWIIAHGIGQNKKQENIKIIVKEENTWNLIEPGELYNISYESSSDSSHQEAQLDAISK